MNKTFAIMTAGALALASASVFADNWAQMDAAARDAEALKNQDAMIKASQNPQGRNIGITKAAEAAKAENAKRQAAMAKMTPEQQAAARQASDAEALNYQDAMIKASQNPQGRNIGITKAAEAAKAENAKKQAAMAKMTPEQQAAARQARDSEALKYQATMEKLEQKGQ